LFWFGFHFYCQSVGVIHSVTSAVVSYLFFLCHCANSLYSNAELYLTSTVAAADTDDRATLVAADAGVKYLWCACGDSPTQPFTADGACCKKNGFTPREYVAEKTEVKNFCVSGAGVCSCVVSSLLAAVARAQN
jgi:CDGSH-type Zn-finger protein